MPVEASPLIIKMSVPVYRWLRTFPAENPLLHVVCFPPAGGASGSFAALRAAAGPGVAISIAMLPGREARISEPAAADLCETADRVATCLLETGIGGDAPYVLLGLSMGALLGYETALRLQQARACPPLEVTVAAAPAPDHPEWDRAASQPMEIMRLLGGVPADVFDSPELLEIASQALADDLAMLAGYRCAGGVLSAPLRVLRGSADPAVTADAVLGWAQFSRAEVTTAEFPCGHFFLKEDYDQIVSSWFARATV
jgi:surfactin synthase thioesterase subunit